MICIRINSFLLTLMWVFRVLCKSEFPVSLPLCVVSLIYGPVNRSIKTYNGSSEITKLAKQAKLID